MKHLADYSAGGHDLVSALDLPDHRVLRLALLLPRADEDEVEDREDRAIHENRAEQRVARRLEKEQCGKCGCHRAVGVLEW